MGKLFVWKEMVQKEAVATLKIGPGPASGPSWSMKAEIPVAEESGGGGAFLGPRRSGAARHLLLLAPGSPREFSLLPFLE